MNIADLVCEFEETRFTKQHALFDYLGEHSFNFSLKTGLISFGRDRTFPFQLLGTESEYDDTWMWAWAESVSNIPEALTESSRALREFGASNGIDEFDLPKLECVDVNGHLLSMLASGVCNADAYYRCPYDGGAAFMLVGFGGPLPEVSPLVLRMQTVFTEFISGFEVANQKAALSSYARIRGVRAVEDGSDLRLSARDGSVASFDRLDRLVEFVVEIRPPTAPN